MPTIDDIEQAAMRLADLARLTPALNFPDLDRALGCQAVFKCEQLQRGGSFKLRGAGNCIRTRLERGEVDSVATHSSGNHGAAVALAAREAGLKATVVMPDNSLQSKIRNVQRFGGQVELCEPTQAAREAGLSALVEAGASAIHPYDDADIVAGQGTAARELLVQHPDIEMLLTPVGGGGLLAGTLLAADGRIRVMAAEPEGAGETMASLESGERITEFQPDTIADGLRATVGKIPFAVIQPRVEKVLPVSDQEIVEALWVFWDHTRLLIEPSSATVIAAIRRHPGEFSDRTVGVILTGGNVDFGQLPGRPDQRDE